MSKNNKYQKLKNDLLQEKNQLEMQKNHMEEYQELDIGTTIGELASYDNHPADLGSEVFERSKDLTLIEGIKHNLKHIDHALKKLENNTYGVCDKCGKEISKERLEAIPSTTLCINCKETREKRTDNNRPVEEDVVDMLPQDYKGNDNMYDGENVWRELVRYGTSDSPQDSERPRDYQNLVEDKESDKGVVEEIEGVPYVEGDDGMFYEEI